MTQFKTIAGIVVAVLVMISVAVIAQDGSRKAKLSTMALDSEASKLGYTFGAQIGGQLAGAGLGEDVDVEAVVAAIRDVFGGNEPRMTLEEMQQAQAAYQQKAQAKIAALSSENQAKGDEFLASNAKKDGVVTAESGLQYEVIREGKGKQPTTENTVKVHYAGSLIDGTEFDSSYKRGAPADFPVTGVIPGFSEGLQLMKEGSKYRFVIPAAQAYGEQAPPTIGPNQVLIFDVELIEVL